MSTAMGLRMKLLIDTKRRRVVFAEAGKDVVDFLFSLLALPFATAVRLLGEASIAGSVGNLYASVSRLDRTYILPGASRSALLRPTVAASPAATTASALLLPAPSSSLSRTFYKCGNASDYGDGRDCGRYVTDARGATCPSCYGWMKKRLEYVPASPAGSGSGLRMVPRNSGADGFVQGVVTYTVTDDLAVAPMSSISSITLLNAYGITHLAMLQEKTVRLGYREGLEILRASLHSKTVLTDVFLRY